MAHKILSSVELPDSADAERFLGWLKSFVEGNGGKVVGTVHAVPAAFNASDALKCPKCGNDDASEFGYVDYEPIYSVLVQSWAGKILVDLDKLSRGSDDVFAAVYCKKFVEDPLDPATKSQCGTKIAVPPDFFVDFE